MADKILKQNKIPGCERLTRPEEIKALSKYLKHIKETLEENTDLDETSLEIPGKTTGLLHDISELPVGYDKLDASSSIENTKLSTYQDKIEDTREQQLSDYIDPISGINEVESLYDSVIGLEDSREQELSNYKETIVDDKESVLSNYKDTIIDSREQELSNYKDTIVDDKESVLSNYKDTIIDSREQELSNYKDTIVDDKENVLSNYKDTIVDDKENSLSNYKDTIVDDKENSLSNYKDTIIDSREQELSNYKDTIVDEKENSLSNYKDTIIDEKEPFLSDYKDTIVDEKENSLSNYKDTIIDEKEPFLSDYKDTIVDEKENSLGNYKDTIIDEKEPFLSDYKDTIVDSREPELENYIDPISGINEVESLYDSVIGLEDSRNPELEDYIDPLVDENEPSLEDFINQLDEGEFKDPIKPTTNLPLDQGEFKTPVKPTTNLPLDQGEFKDPIKPNTNLELPESENPIFHNEFNTDGSPGYYGSWDNVIPKLTDDREPELEDTVIPKNYGPGENPRDDDGYDYIDNEVDYNSANPIIQQKSRQKFERHQKVLEKPESENPIFHNEFNTDGSPGYYGSWDDTIPKLVDQREPELEDTVISKDTIYNPETGTLGTDGLARTDGEYDYIDNSIDYNNANPIIQQKAKQKFERHQEILEKPEGENSSPIYNELLNLDEKELYSLVLQLLNDSEGNSNFINQDAEWNQKISGLVSAYLQPHDERDSLIQPNNAHRFEEELFRSINIVGVERDQGGEYRPRLDNMEGGLSRNSDGTARIDGNYDFIDIYTSNLNAEQNRASRHTEDEYKNIPISDIPQQGSTNLMRDYIRYIAEQSVGIVNGDSIRKYLLEEVLWTLILTRRVVEKETEVNRDRLPGHSIYKSAGTLIDEIYGAIQDGNILNTATNFIFRYLKERPNPINRPEINPINGEKYNTYYFTSANSRYNKNQNEGEAGVFKNLWERIISNLSGELPSGDYVFSDNYLRGGGITTTLKDLCGSSPELIWSVEDLMDTLKRSPYITTPSKFGTIHEGSYGTQTLDSNSYWEVIIEPLCDDYLNGGYSYLPCFNEINVINAATHGVNTAYNKWVPISNFELQKAKLTTKSIGLFDGEFSIPISSELTNEIRFTIVDDQYKSWRNYFQKCMDVAVYNSNPHNKYFYGYEDNGTGFDAIANIASSIYNGTYDKPLLPTDYVSVVDKSMICVAFYKNIAFRIRIYIMTPQYSTIRRFDLLCVLKDFSEEYSGDIDSGGVDLNVTFSIVGENPDGADQEEIRDRYINNIGDWNTVLNSADSSLELFDNSEFNRRISGGISTFSGGSGSLGNGFSGFGGNSGGFGGFGFLGGG